MGNIKNTGMVFMSLLMAVGFIACQPSAEQEADALQIHPVQHGSLVLEWQGKRIFVDPAGGSALFRKYRTPDLVLITHPHGDHCSPETLQDIATEKATLVLPSAMQAQEKTEALAFKERHILENGSTMSWQGIEIEAVPMYNLPNDSTARHPKGWGNGYVLTIGGQRIYISGDTEDIPEMRALKNIDIAFVCMNLPYTMSVEQAVDGVAAFRPKQVYPYHYRGKDPQFSDVEAFRAALAEQAPEVEVVLAKWY